MAGNEDKEFSMEANEQMLSFLKEMEELQRTNPQAFNELLNSMGVGGDDASSSMDATKSNNNGVGGVRGGEPTNTMNRQTIIDAISQLRDQNSNGVPSGIELPGGKGTLSSNGVQSRMKGITITPDPGFTIKTRREDDSKVFINLCQHAELAIPSIKKKLNEDGEEIEGMNIPLSVGPGKEGKDKSGVSCTIYDVIVNPQVLRDVLEDPTGKHRDFICQLAIQSVEQKYKLNLDKRYKLPKIRYLGEITSQQIQDRKQMPKIEEIEVKGGGSSSSNASKGKKPEKTEMKPMVKEAERPLCYTLHWKYEDNKEILYDDNTLEVQEYEAKMVISNTSTSSNPATKPYSEPLTVPDDGAKSLIFRALLDIKCVNDPKNITMNISPFRFDSKISGYLPCNFYFPCAVANSKVKSVLHRLPGYTQVVELVVIIPIDVNPWSTVPDPGSKPWLVAEALKSGEDEHSSSSSASTQKRVSSGGGHEGGEFPEDKFHIQLPDNVDKYTGVKYPTEQNDEFPEDRFHRQDAISQYIIEQRDKDIKAKWDKHEKEKAERKNDPNVEYIDVEDFKPGGKYGPQPIPTSSKESENILQEDLQRAARIVASSSLGVGVGVGGGGGGGGDQNESPSPSQSQSQGVALSSHLWTELLD